jgi:hypothetical protein
MKQTLRRILYPIRKLAAKFVTVDVPISEDPIIFKAANLIAAEKVDGDFLEFGVSSGSSLIHCYHTLKTVFEQHQKVHAWRTEKDAQELGRIWDHMRFFAFDSFQGLPELHGFDQNTQDFSGGKYACTEARLRERLAREGVPLEKVMTVSGWFEQSCTEETIMKHAIRRASIIHIDCDLYSSAKTALEFVRSLLVDGTIIIFDDWYSFRGNPNLGEQRAFNEWRATMPDWVFTEYQKEGPWRNSFIASTRKVA